MRNRVALVIAAVFLTACGNSGNNASTSASDAFIACVVSAAGQAKLQSFGFLSAT